MTEEMKPVAVKKPKKRARKVIVFLVIVIAALWYLNSDRFQERIRRSVVAGLENATGGRVELKSFTWKLFDLEFNIADLTIHGLEPPSEIPYAHVDHLKVQLKILSVFGREVGLNYLSAENPVIHIMVYPDGTTNQPSPKVKDGGSKTSIDSVFDMAVERMELNKGVVIWNDKKFPFDLKADNVTAQMSFDQTQRSYEGSVASEGVMFTYRDYRPFTSNAKLRFSLTRDAMQIKSLNWSSRASNIEASGKVTEWKDPKLELAFRGSLNAEEWGSALRVNELRAGGLDVTGTMILSSKVFSSSGNLDLKNLTWQDPGFLVTHINGISQFALNKDKIILSKLVLQTLGGVIQGEAHVQDWANFDAQQRVDKKLPIAVQHGTATLNLIRLSVARIAESFASRDFPLDKLHAEGTASGNLGLDWRGSLANTVATLQVDVVPPENPAVQSLPLSAHMRGSFSVPRKTADVAEFTMQTPHSKLSATGLLGTDAGRISLNVESSDLGELDPLLSTGTSTFPVILNGRAAFVGTLSGKLGQPTIRGRLEMAGFESVLTVETATPQEPGAPASGPVIPKRVHWDALNVDLDYSPQLLVLQNGQLRRSTAQVDFSGQSSLLKGRFDSKTSTLKTHIILRDAGIADLQSLAGTNYQVTGTVNAEAEVSGTIDDLSGHGRLKIDSGTLFGESFKNLSSNVNFKGPEVQFQDVSVAQNGATLMGSGAYNLTSRIFQFDARGENVNIANIQALKVEKISLGGVAGFTAKGSGTLQEPVLTAVIDVRNLTVNGEVAGDLKAEAVTHGRELKIKARSSFENAFLAADGSVQLNGDYPSQLSVRFNDFSFDPIIRAYLRDRMQGAAFMSGTLELSGPLRHPSLLRVDGKIDKLAAEIEKIKLSNPDPIDFLMENGQVALKHFHVTGEDTDVTASGTFQLTGDRAMNIDANGQANLKLFQGFSPGLLSHGHTTVQMKVGGTMQKPALTGEVLIKDAGVSFIDLPNGLSDINGQMVFNENRLQVRKLTAKTGGGQLDIGGFIAYRSGLFFNLTATGQEIRVRYPPGVSTSMNADLRLVGTPASSLLSGEMLITRFGVNPRFDFALYLARSKQQQGTQQANQFLDNMRVDVHVSSTPELRVETSLAKISGDVDLRIRGTASLPALLGRVNIVEGEVVFSGTKYRLERGDITFTNPLSVEAVVNLEATARVRDYDITLGFHGKLENKETLSVSYRSDPPLPSADIIALLALGRTREESVVTSQQTNQSFTEATSNAILGQALDAAVSSRVEKLFGASRIKIDPQIGGLENLNARVTIEQQVTNNVTLTYITNLSQSSQQVIQGEFNVTRNVSIVIVRDQNGVLGFEIRVRQRKK